MSATQPQPAYRPKRRICRIDGWRSYMVPSRAIVGASDTGMWPDSPCRSDDVAEELKRFRREVLRPARIRSRTVTGASSNVFCAKRWIVVAEKDFDRAVRLVKASSDAIRFNYRLLHDAELNQLKEEQDNG